MLLAGRFTLLSADYADSATLQSGRSLRAAADHFIGVGHAQGQSASLASWAPPAAEVCMPVGYARQLVIRGQTASNGAGLHGRQATSTAQ